MHNYSPLVAYSDGKDLNGSLELNELLRNDAGRVGLDDQASTDTNLRYLCLNVGMNAREEREDLFDAAQIV